MKKQFTYITFALASATMMVACSSGGEEKKEEVTFLPLVKLEMAAEKNFVHEIRVQGNIETDQDVLLNAEMGGQIIKIYVKEGQRVSAGQTLVSLDASILASNLNEIQTQLEYAEYMLQKQEELKKRGVGSEFDYETAKNQVSALKSKMKSVNAQKGKSTITAPFSGVIDHIYGKDGQVVGPQNPLVRLVNNSKVEVTADISEKHLGSIGIGTPVEVRFPNFRDTTLKVKITNIGNYIEPANRTFRVQAEIPNNKVLLPNMLAELAITDMNVADALVIPSVSIIKDQDNNDFVYKAVKTGKKDEYKVEKVGVRVVQRFKGEAMIELVSGKLNEGNFVVTDGAKGVTENDIVRTK